MDCAGAHASSYAKNRKMFLDLAAVFAPKFGGKRADPTLLEWITAW